MGFVFRRVATSIAGVGRNAVAEVIDAHLETLSMIFLTTLWAITYGWFEGTAEDVGKWFPRWFDLGWTAPFNTYHLMIAVTIFAITFSFGFLKFTRMLYRRKRHMLFTALGNFSYAMALEDFAYFFFSVSYARLQPEVWTCQILNLGCMVFKWPWQEGLPFVIPRWYFVAFAFSAVMFFLAYRTALVNLLVTRQIMKEIGFIEKVRIRATPQAQVEPVVPTIPSVPLATEPGREQTPPVAPAPVVTTKTEQTVSQIIDAEREDLMRRLRERLERGS